MPSKIAAKPKRRIIQTSPRCPTSTIPTSIIPSHTPRCYIQYLLVHLVLLFVPPVPLLDLDRKTGSLSLRGCRGTETRYTDFYVRIIYFKSCLSIGFYSGLLLTGDARLWSNSQFYPRVHRQTIILENNPVSIHPSYPCRR